MVEQPLAGAMSKSGRVLSRLTSLVSNNTTGVLWLRATTWLRIELVQGWVHAYSGVEPPAEPEQLAAAARARHAPFSNVADMLQRLLEAALLAPHTELVESDEPRVRLGAVTPFHPARVLRAIVEARLTLVADGASLLDERVPVDRGLSLAAPFHPSGLDPDEQRLAILLSGTPLRLRELLARAGCAEPRARRLLRNLLVLGMLRADGAMLVSDLAELTLLHAERVAAEEQKRRAYHAAAREVHPDLRPNADDAERAALTDQMAELAARRRRGES